MLNKIRTTIATNKGGLQNFSIYFGSNLMAKLVPFFMLPIITAYLVPSEYGVWALFWMFITLLRPALAVGGQHHINRNFHQLEKPVLANQILNLMAQSAALFAVFMVIIFGIAQMQDSFFSIPSEMLYLVPVIAFLIALMKFTTSLLLYEKRPWFFAYIESSFPLFTRLFAIIGLAGLAMSWQAMSWGTFISAIIVSASCMIYLYRNDWLKPPFSLKVSLAMLAVNAPLIPHLLLSPLHGMVDRIMLEKFMSTEEVGIYSIGYTFGTTIMIIIGAYTKVWQPWVYKLLADPTEDNKRKIIRSTYLYYGIIIAAAIAIYIGSSIYIHLFFTDAYLPAINVIFWVALTGLPQIISQTGLIYLNQQEKTLFFPILSAVAVIFNFALNAVMIPSYGIIGAALATLMSFSIQAIIVFALAYKHMPMPWLSCFRKN